MGRVEVQIPAPDGRSNGTLHLPDGDGSWPGVLVFPDAGGVRETFRLMGDRLASTGYAVLIPDIYYRAVPWTPFDVATLFTDPQEGPGCPASRACSPTNELSPMPQPTRTSCWAGRK
jgi:carboxymethylenebutenolidase